MTDLSTGNVFTLIQALQLVGLTPCLFLIFFLCTLIRRNGQVAIPIFYFMALACGFALPLSEAYPSLAANHWLQVGLLFGESMLASFSFLLVLQFLSGRVPPLPYFLVLAVPLVGGSSLLYAGMLQTADICSTADECLDVGMTKTLYTIFSSALIFLLLVVYSSRSSLSPQEVEHRKHKYWLVIALIMLNLFALAMDLARLSGRISLNEAELAIVVFRLSFIYLVITSLFRVFYPALAGQIITLPAGPTHNPEADKPHVEKIKTLLEGDKIFREMRLNRAALAERVGINEHYLSRIINRYFGKNFNELVNGYRIEEAKHRLSSEPNQQITVIGFEVGFNSIASFNRVFKEMAGVSPTEWRAANSQ